MSTLDLRHIGCYIGLGLIFIVCSFVGCVPGTNQPDIVRIERDVEVACHVWRDTKIVAVAAGLFVPGVSSAAIIIDTFVRPVCDGVASIDADTAEWISIQIDSLRYMTYKRMAYAVW